MKLVHADGCGSFNVAEDESHKMHLVNGDQEVVGMYEVDVVTKHKVFVLATSEQKAIGQAECVLGVASYERNEDCQVESTAFQRKFAVEGWSRNLF